MARRRPGPGKYVQCKRMDRRAAVLLGDLRRPRDGRPGPPGQVPARTDATFIFVRGAGDRRRGAPVAFVPGGGGRARGCLQEDGGPGGRSPSPPNARYHAGTATQLDVLT